MIWSGLEQTAKILTARHFFIRLEFILFFRYFELVA
ncbi:hypothetical protein Q671_10650 [Halomonas sp. PBN3]|nr:hypothetical protein Q671_10650 [Halomonas sp. PBN3]